MRLEYTLSALRDLENLPKNVGGRIMDKQEFQPLDAETITALRDDMTRERASHKWVTVREKEEFVTAIDDGKNRITHAALVLCLLRERGLARESFVAAGALSKGSVYLESETCQEEFGSDWLRENKESDDLLRSIRTKPVEVGVLDA